MEAELELNNTQLPIIKLSEEDELKPISENYVGYEGAVYECPTYPGLAIKIFKRVFRESINRERFILKLRKIEVFARLERDECFASPIGFVGKNNTGLKEGFFMPSVKKINFLDDFDNLRFLPNDKKKMSTIIKGSDALKRLHQRGITVGDLKGDNILIDETMNPVFVDFDNYAGLGFSYDIKSYCGTWLRTVYNKDYSYEDSDKFLYALLALQSLIRGYYFSHPDFPEYYRNLVDSLRISKDIKEGLRAILSDADDKPYVGDVLKDYRITERPILSFEDMKRFNLHIMPKYPKSK